MYQRSGRGRIPIGTRTGRGGSGGSSWVNLANQNWTEDLNRPDVNQSGSEECLLILVARIKKVKRLMQMIIKKTMITIGPKVGIATMAGLLLGDPFKLELLGVGLLQVCQEAEARFFRGEVGMNGVQGLISLSVMKQVAVLYDTFHDLKLSIIDSMEDQ